MSVIWSETVSHNTERLQKNITKREWKEWVKLEKETKKDIEEIKEEIKEVKEEISEENNSKTGEK